MREDIEEENLQRDAAENQTRNPEKRKTSRRRAPERGGMKMNDTQREEKRSHGIGEVKGRGEKRRTGTVMSPEREETEEVTERKEVRGTEESETGSQK